jgi:hypothetical protein
LTIAPGFSLNLKPTGIFTVNSGVPCGLALLNSTPLLNAILSAVEARNEPRTSNLAFGPNTIPFGFIKNKFAEPNTPKVPNILEGLPPVTRLKILVMPLGFPKYAPRPSLMLNSPKL